MKTYTTTVQAGKIEKVFEREDGGMLVLEGGKEIEVSRSFLASRKPREDSYFVRYSSGEEVCLSAGAFEARFDAADHLAPDAAEHAESPDGDTRHPGDAG